MSAAQEQPRAAVFDLGDAELPKRLVVLMAARLVLALVSLGVALVLDATVADFTLTERRGFYGTVALAFLATAGYGLALPHIRRRRLFAALNVGTDVALVSALVHLSGGPDSPFVFLYVLVAVYGAVLFGRRGALATAACVALAYGSVLALSWQGWLGPEATPPFERAAVLLSNWLVHAGAVMLVAVLSSFLAVELRRTGQELRQRTSELRGLQSLHERIVESLMSGLLTVDSEGRVTSFNPESEKITGLSRSEALQRPVEEILPGISQVSIGRAREAAQGAESRARMPYRNVRGEDFYLGVASYVLKEPEGGCGGHVVIFQDLTRVVEMEQELRRSERLAAVGQLAASIAHEVRNPLAAISGSVQVLRSKHTAAEGADEPRRLMDIVLREIDRLDHLITDFLHFACPRAPEPEPIDAGEAIEQVLELFRAECADGVEVSADVEPGLRVLADPDQLRQVLWNLLRNAADAMPEGGPIELSGAAVESSQEPASEGRNAPKEGTKLRWAEITIADRGTGVPADVVDRIFEPFFTTKSRGSGLGLPTVHRIVENHGGSMRLEARSSGGVRVRLRLPRAEDPA